MLFDTPDPLALIQTLKPDVLVKGADWTEETIIGGEFVKSKGGRVVRISLVRGSFYQSNYSKNPGIAPAGLDQMIFTNQNGVSFYQFNNLSACSGIDHRVFTRNSGFSQPPFAGLNVSFGIGDAKENVFENRGIISRSMGSGELVFAQQTHGCEIAVLNRENEEKANIADGRKLPRMPW